MATMDELIFLLEMYPYMFTLRQAMRCVQLAEPLPEDEVHWARLGKRIRSKRGNKIGTLIIKYDPYWADLPAEYQEAEASYKLIPHNRRRLPKASGGRKYWP